MSRWDSAAIVSNTSELLPEPETPVKTVSRRFGISTLTSLRLFTRAPSTRIRSWRSARGDDVVCVVLPVDIPVDMAVLIGSPSVGRSGGFAVYLISDVRRNAERRSGPARRAGVPVRGTLCRHPPEPGAVARLGALAATGAVVGEAVPALGTRAGHRGCAHLQERDHGASSTQPKTGRVRFAASASMPVWMAACTWS